MTKTAETIFAEQTKDHELPETIPLFRELDAEAQPYPVCALMGLAAAAEAIQYACQAPMAFGAQSLLTATSMASQSFADIRMPFDYGPCKPCSIYTVTVGQTGARKDASDKLATRPVLLFEETLCDQYESAMHEYTLDKKLWDSRKSASKKDRAELSKLGGPPAKPIHPMMILNNTTYEAMCITFLEGRLNLGLLATEGGIFLGGPGMKAETKMTTGTGLSSVHDGEPIRRTRSTDKEITFIRDCRLSMHLMVQPDIARTLYTDRTLGNQGLLSRILFTFPESTIGTRLLTGRERRDVNDKALDEYHHKLTDLLKCGEEVRKGKRGIITLSDTAKQIWTEYHDRHEYRMRRQGELAEVGEFVNKMPEHVLRVAANLALYGGSEVINADAIESAAELIEYYIGEVLRLNNAGHMKPDMVIADKLLTWLCGRKGKKLVLREILRSGPKQIRTKTEALRAIDILEEHHHLIRQRGEDDTWFINAG